MNMSGDNSCKLNRGMKTSVSVSQQFTMADQCPLDPDGTLKDASEILFYNDLDDPHPFLPPLSAPKALSPGLRAKQTDWLSKSIIQEQLGSDIEDDEGFVLPKSRPHKLATSYTTSNKIISTSNPFDALPVEVISDALDGNYSDLSMPGLELVSRDETKADDGFKIIMNEQFILSTSWLWWQDISLWIYFLWRLSLTEVLPLTKCEPRRSWTRGRLLCNPITQPTTSSSASKSQ